jgi:hypothetical protein
VPEPAAAELQRLLALTDDELLHILGTSPVELLTGEEDAREDVRLLVTLTRDAADASVLQRWVRADGPDGRPLDLLRAQDFAGYEKALETLTQRGFVLRGGGRRPR